MHTTPKPPHILSIDQFSRSDLDEIFQLADEMIPYARGEKVTRVLEGAILGNLFFEPSTRSRVSFGAAFNRLGGMVRETVGIEASSIAKGESLWDTAQVLSGYVDVIVMRHPQRGAVEEFSNGSRVPVINGGDGDGEHPTQALLDLYTLLKDLGRGVGSSHPLHVAVVGDLKYGRAAHSFVKVLSLLESISITCVCPPELDLPEEVRNLIVGLGHDLRVEPSLAQGLAQADVVYVTRIQQERFKSLDAAAPHIGKYRINKELLSSVCKPDVLVMHPLPRDSRPSAGELSNDLNGDRALAIFRQTDNGIPVRMALFARALGVQSEVHHHATSTRWRSQRL